MTLATGDAPPIGPIAMVGGGQMALALAAGFCRAGLVSPSEITVHDPVAAQPPKKMPQFRRGGP